MAKNPKIPKGEDKEVVDIPAASAAREDDAPQSEAVTFIFDVENGAMTQTDDAEAIIAAPAALSVNRDVFVDKVSFNRIYAAMDKWLGNNSWPPTK